MIFKYITFKMKKKSNKEEQRQILNIRLRIHKGTKNTGSQKKNSPKSTAFLLPTKAKFLK